MSYVTEPDHIHLTVVNRELTEDEEQKLREAIAANRERNQKERMVIRIPPEQRETLLQLFNWLGVEVEST